MVIKRLKTGLKKIAAGVCALLALSGFTAHAGDKALADSIREYNNWAIMTGVAGVVGVTCGVGGFVMKWLTEDKEAEVVTAVRTNRAPGFKLNQVAQFKAARRLWLAQLASNFVLGASSGLLALSVVRDDEYNSQARFTAGLYGATACLATGGMMYKIF